MFYLPTSYIIKEYNNKGHTSAAVTGSSVNVELFLTTPVVASTLTRLVLYCKIKEELIQKHEKTKEWVKS